MKRLTTPEVMNLTRRLYPTGNHFVSLPVISEADASIDRVGVLHEATVSLVEFGGRQAALGAETLPPLEPFLRPFVQDGGRRRYPAQGELTWRRLWDWIPSFEWTIAPPAGKAEAPGPVSVRGTIFAPIWRDKAGVHSHKGFVYVFEVRGGGEAVRVGLSLTLADLVETVYTSRRLPVEVGMRRDRWTGGPVLEPRSGAGSGPVALAVAFSGDAEDVEWGAPAGGPAGALARAGAAGAASASPVAGDTRQLPIRLDLVGRPRGAFAFYFGLNREGDGARTVAIDLARRGWQSLLAETGEALSPMRRAFGPGGGRAGGGLSPSDLAFLEARANLNLFFNYFFAVGRTIDHENLVLVTSRSPLYYVSAAFWARDALLWSFPGLLLADPLLAEEAIGTAFDRYFTHAGVHSLYLDGTLLYPGFELDELAAYPIALWRYVDSTGDKDILARRNLVPKLHRILDLLEAWAHPDPSVHLYRTFLLPSDDPASHPYVTYDNVMAWRALLATADLLDWAAEGGGANGPGAVAVALGMAANAEGPRDPASLRRKAILVRADINRYCVVPVPGDSSGGQMYAWSTDLAGRTEIGDEPPGSLELLAYYGFCPRDDEIWRNTVYWLSSRGNPYRYLGVPFPGLGCPHAEHPFVMSLFNALLGGLAERVEEAKGVLVGAPLDTGLACESFDRETGEVRTGAAFATCAGFLAYAIDRAFGPRAPGETRNDDWPVEIGS